MKHLKIIIIAVVIIGTFAGTAYVVQAKKSESENVEAVTQVNVSLSKAIEIALQQVPGHVVGVEFENDDGNTLWEVEVFSSEKAVFELEIDATSGKVLKKQNEEDEENDDDDNDDRD